MKKIFIGHRKVMQFTYTINRASSHREGSKNRKIRIHDAKNRKETGILYTKQEKIGICGTFIYRLNVNDNF